MEILQHWLAMEEVFLCPEHDLTSCQVLEVMEVSNPSGMEGIVNVDHLRDWVGADWGIVLVQAACYS